MKNVLVTLGFVFSLCSCVSYDSTNPTHAAVAGGAGGAGLGAGIGALVGSLISSGDVGASAALGAGIGLPVGAALGYYYIRDSNYDQIKELDDEIEGNYDFIIRTEEELEALRRGATDDSFVIRPDDSVREELYLGPSLGNPYRP